MDLEIKGFLETSFLDWDGKVVSTLYVPTCNFKCPFCHNSGLIEAPQQYATVPLDKIKAYLLKQKDFIDGICLTGGEPCLHRNKGLFEFLRDIKGMGFKVKLDTNGSDPDVLKKLIDEGLLDHIAMDIKAPLDERYDKLAGVKVDISKIKKSIEIIMGSGVDYEFRTTVVPTLLDKKDVEDIAIGIKGAKKFMLQQFDPKNSWDKGLTKVKPYPKKELEEMAAAAGKFVEQVSLRGAR